MADRVLTKSGTERGATPDTGGGGGRRFARLTEGRSTAEGYWPLPPDGLCLSSFLLLSRPKEPGSVLVGRIDPQGPWNEIGALDPHRVQLNADGWMLPSCHLLYFESPDDAARRILWEQLGLEGVSLQGPRIFSEKYRPRRHPQRGEHWDLQFLYTGVVPSSWVPAHPAWVELRFIEPAKVARAEFTRSHDEVLELAGFGIG